MYWTFLNGLKIYKRISEELNEFFPTVIKINYVEIVPESVIIKVSDFKPTHEKKKYECYATSKF